MVVIAAVVVAAGLVAGGGADRTVRDAEVVTPDLDRVAARTPSRPSAPAPTVVTEPVCLDGTDCFAWVVEVPGWNPQTGHLVAAFDDLLVTAGSEGLIAYAIADGTVRWRSAPDVGRPVTGAVVPVDDLVLTLVRDELVALDAADGTTRWRIGDLDVVSIHQARADGGVLRVAVELADDVADVGDGLDGDDPSDVALVGGHVLALDPGTGRLVWQVALDGFPSLTPTHAVATTSDGAVVAHDLGGDEAWRTDDLIDVRRGDGIWAAGPLVTVYTDRATTLLRTEDGTTVEGLDGDVVGVDDDGVLVHDHDTGRRSLYQDGEVRWSTDADASCVLDLRLSADRIETTTCDGEVEIVDRRDGSVVGISSAPIAVDDLDGFWSLVGGYGLGPSRAGSDGDEDTLVRDLVGGRDVALLAPYAFPVGREIAGRWSTDPGTDRVVIAADRWLIALPTLEDTPVRPRARGG